MPSVPIDLFLHERAAWAAGHRVVAGIDEAGRGALAGPVVAACVILPAGFDPAGIDDSKKLTSKQREAACGRIHAEAVAVGVGIVAPEIIDRINILRATHEAMRTALDSLRAAHSPTIVLIDGLPVPFLDRTLQQAIVGGDALSATIAAASIVAKVTRDRIMVDHHAEYPHYGFANHKGYAVAAHLAALDANGPCPIHRRSFAPVLRAPSLFDTVA
jgi:ribonuclease HII